jgi:hypothetical protein
VADFSGQEQVLWYEKTSYFGMLTATFVNCNSFATAYAELVLVVTTRAPVGKRATLRGHSRRGQGFSPCNIS